MALLTVTNNTTSRLPIDSILGIIEGSNEVTYTLTGNDIERVSTRLNAMRDAGLLSYEVAASEDPEVAQVIPGVLASRWLSGVGVPEGAVAAPVGTLYSNKSGGAGTTLYIKQVGTGLTGWAAL